MSPSAAGDAGAPTLDAYAARHGLYCRSASFGLPKATQLMRHGFMQEVPSLARGDLPGGLGDGWLALANYAYEGRSDIERDPFTLVLVGAAASSSYAVRVLCHDRGLGERERSNPDADRQVVELDDRQAHLESDKFLARYEVSTDHDQGQLKVWQIFSPGLIAWLTEEAPAGFSFELQDGALCCFVPGLTADPAELDALCAGAARVHSRIAEIEGSGAATSGDGTRADLVDRQLAEHPLNEVVESAAGTAAEWTAPVRHAVATEAQDVAKSAVGRWFGARGVEVERTFECIAERVVQQPGKVGCQEQAEVWKPEPENPEPPVGGPPPGVPGQDFEPAAP